MKEEYFKRQIELWGAKRQESLKDKSVLIVGSGGLGSSFAYALGSSGIGNFDVVDFDRVSYSNIHRQILFDIKDEGRYKAEVFKEKIESRSPNVAITPYFDKFSDFIKKSDKSYDIILDATDNFQTRAEIDNYAKAREIPWIYTGVEEFFAKIAFIYKSDFKKLAKFQSSPKGIVAPTVMFAASFSSNLALRYLAGFEVKKDLLYYFDLSLDEIALRKFKL